MAWTPGEKIIPRTPAIATIAHPANFFALISLSFVEVFFSQPHLPKQPDRKIDCLLSWHLPENPLFYEAHNLSGRRLIYVTI
jgi:hypothetical protein